jgi:enamine deaminase RidA (YjgF/YER057c/UK114 family)
MAPTTEAHPGRPSTGLRRSARLIKEDLMAARMQLLQPEGLGKPLGLYSHGALISQPAKLLFVAGQLAVDQAGQVVGAGDFDAQMRQAFSNVGHVLADAEMEFADVLKFTTYLVEPGHVESFYSTRAELFPALFPTAAYPPNTLLVIHRLVRPEFLIEIEAVAGRA